METRVRLLAAHQREMSSRRPWFDARLPKFRIIRDPLSVVTFVSAMHFSDETKSKILNLECSVDRSYSIGVKPQRLFADFIISVKFSLKDNLKCLESET